MQVNSDCSSNQAARGNLVGPFLRWMGGICKQVRSSLLLVVIHRRSCVRALRSCRRACGRFHGSRNRSCKDISQQPSRRCRCQTPVDRWSKCNPCGSPAFPETPRGSHRRRRSLPESRSLAWPDRDANCNSAQPDRHYSDHAKPCVHRIQRFATKGSHSLRLVNSSPMARGAEVSWRKIWNHPTSSGESGSSM